MMNITENLHAMRPVFAAVWIVASLLCKYGAELAQGKEA